MAMARESQQRGAVAALCTAGAAASFALRHADCFVAAPAVNVEKASSVAARQPRTSVPVNSVVNDGGAELFSMVAVPMGIGAVALRVGGRRRRSQRVRRRARGGSRGGEQAQLSEIQSWEGLTPGKQYRLQTLTDTVAQDTTTIRSLDWDRDRFDIEFALEKGTTYNAYVIRGAEKTALVDTSHEKFEELFLSAAEKEVDFATLDYLIVSHTEPDHSGLIAKVLQKAQDAGNDKLTIVGSKVCLQFLSNLVFTPFKTEVVANNAKIDLGGGHELEFVIAPNLHWPDTMFTFDHGTGVLYTCDAFGMHYCSDNVVDEESVKELKPHYALYYDCLMKPNARSVLTALKKTSGFEIKQIATGHGPMLEKSLGEYVDLYRNWSEKASEKSGATAAIFWTSNFGHNERLSQVFAHGLTSTGVNVEMHDLNAIDAFEITECLARNELIAVLSPPRGTNAAMSALASIAPGCKPKKHKFLVLSSCEQAQEPTALIQKGFFQQDIPEAAPIVAPATACDLSPQVMQAYEESGMTMGKLMTRKDKAKKVKDVDKDLIKALGRISSSLYVVTAKKAGVRHAMVASWCVPASESPLGITLTIAKDRAMEPLLRVGDDFTVNFLEEGKSLDIMKHFLQKFAPGADRLDGVDCFPGPNGAAVLRAAHAYIECKIVSRMDANDHWVAYCEVNGGNVAKAEALTAVHHRKVGSYY